MEQLQIGPKSRRMTGEPVPVRGQTAALALLNDLGHDSMGMRELRRVYADVSGTGSTSRVSDRTVVADLARRVAGGQLVVTSTPLVRAKAPAAGAGSRAPADAAVKHGSPPTAPAAKQSPEQRETVAPIITPAKFTVVVRKFAKDAAGVTKPYTKPKRGRVVLSTDKAFDGTGTFTRSSDSIRFFKSADRDDEIRFDGKDNVFHGAKLSGGVTLFAEAAKPSGAVDDVVIKLALSGGSKPIASPGSSTITSVEVTLDVCKSQPAAATAPPFSKDDKIHVGRNVLVQDKAGHFHRAKLIIRQVKPATFKGELILSAKNGHVDAFKDEKPKAGETTALPFTIAADKLPAAGEVLWAQGVTGSAAMKDTGFELGIKGVGDAGDAVTMTSVQIRLDVCKSRTAAEAKAATDPGPLAQEDKGSKLGRFLHEQDAGNHHGRALLIVRAVQPANFAGKLTLESLPGGRIEIFPNEKPKAGETAATLPHDFDYKIEKNEDKKFWVQAKTVSVALRDAGYFLHLKDDPPANADTVLITVVKFTKIKATIKSTPANTPANSAAIGVAAPTDHVFETTGVEDDFATNLPLVLVRNSQPDIKLVLSATPGGLPISWDAVRNPLDHATIGTAADKPTRVRNASNFYECKLTADAKGSFRIRPFIDCNGTGDYQALEPSIPLNLVLVDVRLNGADRSAATTVVTPEIVSAAAFTVQTGAWSTAPFTVGANDAMVMSLDVDLVGGGADGKLGLDKVFAGLQNQTQRYNHEATYFDVTAVPPKVHKFRFRYASNKAAATGAYGTLSMFKPGDPAPAQFVLPLLDSGKSPNGQGGDTVTMSRSTTRATAAQPAVGQRMEIWCIDSPKRGFPSTHPLNANAKLISVLYHHEFRANFLIWSNVTKSPGATGDPADRVYSVVRKVPWTLDGNWTLDFFTTPAAPTFVRNAYSVISTGALTVSPVGRAQDHAIEVRPPSGITAGIVVDAQ